MYKVWYLDSVDKTNITYYCFDQKLFFDKTFFFFRTENDIILYDCGKTMLLEKSFLMKRF